MEKQVSDDEHDAAEDLRQARELHAWLRQRRRLGVGLVDLRCLTGSEGAFTEGLPDALGMLKARVFAGTIGS